MFECDYNSTEKMEKDKEWNDKQFVNRQYFRCDQWNNLFYLVDERLGRIKLY